MAQKSTTSEPKKKKFSPKRIAKNIARFFRDLRGEMKKVVWPTKKQVLNNTIVVIVVMLVVGVIIWGLDAGLSAGLKFLLNK